MPILALPLTAIAWHMRDNLSATDEPSTVWFDNVRADRRSCSYRTRFCQHRRTVLVRQRIRSQHIHWDAEQFAQFQPDRADVEQCRLRRRVDQQVQIAPIGISTVKN